MIIFTFLFGAHVRPTRLKLVHTSYASECGLGHGAEEEFLLSSIYRAPFLGLLGSADHENKVFISCKHLFVVIRHFKSFRWSFYAKT
jgi:hypothetical protein